MTAVKTIDVGRWLAERREIDARCARRCAALGWTEVELDKLAAGVDFRDILRSDGGGR